MIAQKLGKITNAETARLQMNILDTYPIRGTVPNYHGVYKRLSELQGIDDIPAKDFFKVAAAFLPPARKGTVSGAPLARDPWYKKYYLKKYPQLLRPKGGKLPRNFQSTGKSYKGLLTKAV